MKVSTKDLLKLFKVQVGQKIKAGNTVMVVTELGLQYNNDIVPFNTLLGVDYEVIQSLEHCTCDDMECGDCPLRLFECSYGRHLTLKEKVDFLEVNGLDPRCVKVLREALNDVPKTSK